MSSLISLGGIQVNSIECINLQHRKDRRKAMKTQARKKKFPIKMIIRKPNVSDPERGRFASHMAIIREAKKHYAKAVMILEDDAKIMTSTLKVPTPPDNWEMLYLGGKVDRIISDESPIWKRACCLLTHAYIVKRSLFDVILEKGKDAIGKVPLDEFYCTSVHPDHPTYMVVPEYIIQENGYSDVKMRHITYSQQSTKVLDTSGDVPKKIDEVETEMNGDQCTLKLPNTSKDELPKVTLITPTSNRKNIFDFAVRNFYTQQYPEEKLQWIIADDSDPDKKVRDCIPGDDQRIKYVNCKVTEGNQLSTSKMVNLCAAYADPDAEIFVHFFDDAYYPPYSVLSRVKLLLKFRESVLESQAHKACVGCTKFGVFDFAKNKSYESFFKDYQGNPTILDMSSLAYTRQFWENRKFDESCYTLPSFRFVVGRYPQVANIPYEFVYVKMFADKLKGETQYNIEEERAQEFSKPSNDNGEDKFSFFNTWDRDTQEFVLLLKETI